MRVLQFKGKTAIECYHHTVAHQTLEFDGELSVLGKGEKEGQAGFWHPKTAKVAYLLLFSRWESW